MLDLGSAPPSNAYLKPESLLTYEKWYPLKVMVCKRCWLAQTVDTLDSGELFTEDYAYLSSFSETLLKSARNYVDASIERFGLGGDNRVVEIASNDGYLLQYVKERGIPCYGVEPTRLAAVAATRKGIETVESFFGETLGGELAERGLQADLMVANNVLAHVPDINDFLKGFHRLLKPNGVVSFEFPHLLRMMENLSFDIVYHEHFSYPSLTAVTSVFATNGLSVFDIEEIDLQGGSLRVYAQRADTGHRPVSDRVEAFLSAEAAAGLKQTETYRAFALRIQDVKNGFLEFLIHQNREGRKVAAYGAAAKGNTFLNYAGIRRDYISFVADRNPAKTGKHMPGSRIPIVDESSIRAEKPDFIVILPWNLRREIMDQLAYVGDWGGRFVVAVPRVEVLHPSYDEGRLPFTISSTQGSIEEAQA